MAEGRFISYLRVSTDKQGRSGLGIEAQREAVVRYLNGGQWTLSAEYVETESGRCSDRPKLAAALSHAKAIGAKLVFAKLDRLTRNVDLLRSLVASGCTERAGRSPFAFLISSPDEASALPYADMNSGV
jgi:DNA invertase Pin-like site-specific DNA recombinase